LVRRGVKDLLNTYNVDFDTSIRRVGAGEVGEAERVRWKMVREREMEERRRKVSEWMKEVVIPKAWL